MCGCRVAGSEPGGARNELHPRAKPGKRGALMNLQSLVNPAVLTQPVYEPGKPIEYVARELGLDPATIIKLASNENPFGPSPKAVEAARAALGQGELYPDGGCYELREKLAKVHGVGADQLVIGNGSNDSVDSFLRRVRVVSHRERP